MDFPNVDRVIYQHNPLVEVVCQLRFPRLFELDKSVPADFQKALGRGFPSIGSRETATFNFGEVRSDKSPVQRRVIFDFSTPKNKSTISLCSDFLSIKTAEYSKWELLFEVIEAAVTALRSSYEIHHYGRVGLRYINIIDRPSLGLEAYSWSELIRGSALGLLGDSEIQETYLSEQSSINVISLPDGNAAIRTGINFESSERKPRFVIDSDFFSEAEIQVDEDAYKLLNSYNRSARNAFRWFIREPLHQALGPNTGT